MHLRPLLVGIVEIDPTAGETFLSRSFSPHGSFLAQWRSECAADTACAVLAADLRRLREDLDTDFQRWQARVAA